MGRRARLAGITNAAVKAARRAAREEDSEAAALAQRIYNVVHEAKRSGECGDVHPLLWAPLVTAAEMAARVVVHANGLGDERMEEVAAYLTAGWLASVQGFDFEHFEGWRRVTAPITGDDSGGPQG